MVKNIALELLKQLKVSRKYIISIQNEIKRICDQYIALNTPQGLPEHNNDNIPIKRGRWSPKHSIQELNERLLEKREKLEAELSKMFEIEDKLAKAAETLPPRDKAIIIDYYMDDKTHDQLAEKYYYTKRHLIRIKNSAIEEIAKHL